MRMHALMAAHGGHRAAAAGQSTSRDEQERRAKKTLHYETLLNERLKVDLQRVLDERDRLYERIANCLELRNNMKMLQEQELTSLKTMVNLGCDFYAKAIIPDTSWVYVDVGLGFRVQMTLQEAVKFSLQREEWLNKQAGHLTERAVDLKARIKLVVGALDEMLGG